MNESNDSVHEEQFGKTENTEKKDKTDLEPQAGSDQEIKEETPPVNPVEPEEDANSEGTGEVVSGSGAEEPPVEEPPVEEPPVEEVVSEGDESETDPGDLDDQDEPEPDSGEDAISSSEPTVAEEPEEEGDAEPEEFTESEPEDEDSLESGSSAPKFVPEKIDYSKLSNEDLVKVLKDLIDTGFVNEIKREVDAIKTNFYKKHKQEIESIRQSFLEAGGQIQDFKVEESPVELELKELLNRYRDLRTDISKKVEEEKDVNLKAKLEIIEGIKELINSQESLNKTFHDFRELQNRWRDMGPVPQGSLKDLWESYHYHVEAFYDYIKINKELRDLDFKKNMEAKMRLCEVAEELLLEPSVVEAFRKLQKLHDQWREIGPVPIEKRAELWERFKEATTKINRKHQEYFVNLKQDQKKNYEEKLLLCEKAEEIAAFELENNSDWEDKSKELIELQKLWKKIGFAPKKYNTQVYDRFRKACDSFFNKKREHYSLTRDEQQSNLQLKTELCIQAEAMKDSTDWKKTTNELIALQKKWKEIGPVPSKLSEKIWKRFRSACDVFFNKKSEYFSHADTRYEENLEKKQKLIEEIVNFQLSADVEKNLKSLKEFQRQWSEIGFVPLKNKNEIQERYREVLNAKFDMLKIDDNKKSILKYRTRLEGINHKPNSDHRMHMEREKCFAKLKQLESDITLWENNIGFFANSENAEAMIKDVQHKIDSAKKKMEQIKDRIRLLDEYED
ncbi:MAG: DUF349 domain-containing protein [Bacteroidales bacterium]|nr:DUF349 domain-containing protein [Bacteroidales bacterium]